VGPTWGFTNISLIEATLISLGIRCQLGKRCEREPRDSATFLLEAACLNEVFSSVPTGKRGKQLFEWQILFI
jgi:hypothetical protein